MSIDPLYVFSSIIKNIAVHEYLPAADCIDIDSIAAEDFLWHLGSKYAEKMIPRMIEGGKGTSRVIRIILKSQYLACPVLGVSFLLSFSCNEKNVFAYDHIPGVSYSSLRRVLQISRLATESHMLS